MSKTRHLLHYLFVVCFLASSALVAGCDSGGDDGDGNGDGNGNQTGTFDVQITGEGVDESFEGIAVWGTGEDPETGEEAFVIVMTSSQTTAGNAVYFYRSSDRPGEGTYDLVSSETGITDAFQALAFSNNVLFTGTEGTLTITSSSSTRIAGTYEFTALNPVDQTEVTVEGSFNALTGAINVPF